MNILVIGSCGFIGSHLCDFFEKDNFVWGVDLVQNTQSNYTITTGNFDGIENLFINHSFDVCINASGNGSVPISMEYPLLDFEKNTQTVIKLLDIIRKFRPDCKYINLSTAAVYGNPVRLPIVETDELSPISPYGFHKYCSELLCKEYAEIFGVQSINLRLFSIYGERLRKQLFWDLFQKVKKSAQIELFGTGEETRDFIYIKDFINAVDCIIKYATFDGRSINIASGTETSIKEVVSIFCSHLDIDASVIFTGKTKEGDPKRWKADISMLKKISFTPQYDIREGLKNTVRWLMENK